MRLTVGGTCGECDARFETTDDLFAHGEIHPKAVIAEVDRIMDTLDRRQQARRPVIPERTPDGHDQVWCLYRPEPFEPGGVEEREMSLWVRRCDVFTSRETAIAFLDTLIGAQVRWQRYADLTGGWFPELWVGRLGHSRWWMTSAPLNPTVGGQG